MPALLITPATIDDVPELDQLVNGAYRGDFSKKGWTTEADLLGGIRTDAEALTRMLQTPGAVILKGTQDGALQACVYLEKQGHRMYLGMLTVSPLLQGAGIGKKMLAASEDHARAENCRSVVMQVISARTELIGWYRRHGYRETGEKKPFPDDPRFGIPKQPLEFIIMEKELN